MKAIFLLTALLIFGSYSPAQELNGKIHEGLSEKGLKNVRLSISGYTESRSDDFGRFSIDLPSKNRGALVNLDVLKEGYAVINREALKARIPDNDSEVLLIYMCAINNRDQLALKYYQIQVNQNIKRNFQAEAKILADQMNYEAMAELGRKKEIAEQMTDSLAARLARFDPKETTEELTRAMQFFQQGNIDSALAVIDPDKIISRIKQRDNLVDQLREANKKDIMALLQAADFALSDFQFQTAENYYQKALEGDSSNFDALGSYAQFLATQNKSDKLIPHAKWMLKKSKNNEQKATSLRFLGNSLYLQKKINEAGQALEKALKIKREMALSGSDSDKSELSLILNSLSRVYTAQNTLQTAIDLLEEAKEIDEELAKKGEVGFKLDLTQTLVNLGVNYTYANRFEEALENFKRAVDILETLNKEESGPYEENLAFALGNLGLTLRDLNKFKEAIPVLERSRDIRKKLSEQNPAAYEAELAKSLNSLGITYRLLSRYKEANSSFQEALSIKRKLAEANPSRYTTEVANLLNNLGLVDQDQKKYKESETHFQEAIDICKKQEKKNPKIYRKNLSIYYTNLGNTYSYLGQSQKAAEKLKEALKIYSNLTSEAPERYKANLADTYLNIGTVYSDLGKKSSALSSYQEALEIYQDLVQENPARYEASLALLQYNLGVFYANTGNPSQSKSYYEKSSILREKLAKANPKAYANVWGKSLTNLALLYKDEFNFSSALTYLLLSDAAYAMNPGNAFAQKERERIAVLIEKYSRKDVLATAYFERGNECINLGQIDTAKIYLERSQKAYSQFEFSQLDLMGKDNLSSLPAFLSVFEKNHKKKYELSKLAIEIKDKLLIQQPEDMELKKSWALAANIHSRNCLFQKAFKEAEETAKKALLLDPELSAVSEFLILAVLYQNRLAEGEKLYLDWKNNPQNLKRYKNYKKVFLATVKELEEAGITHPHVKKAKKLIIEMIKEAKKV